MLKGKKQLSLGGNHDNGVRSGRNWDFEVPRRVVLETNTSSATKKADLCYLGSLVWIIIIILLEVIES